VPISSEGKELLGQVGATAEITETFIVEGSEEARL
jgi:hypothetical protein